LNAQVLRGLNILIVDDVEAIRNLLSRILQALGCGEIIAVADVASAWEATEAQVFDAILLDYTLDEETGLKLVRKLRGSDEAINKDVPIIILTSHSESHFVDAAIAAGADSYLVKPVMPDRLAERIVNAIATRAQNGGRQHSEVTWTDISVKRYN
jgi:two-component system chemotaxis response regulator CheY